MSSNFWLLLINLQLVKYSNLIFLLYFLAFPSYSKGSFFFRIWHKTNLLLALLSLNLIYCDCAECVGLKRKFTHQTMKKMCRTIATENCNSKTLCRNTVLVATRYLWSFWRLSSNREIRKNAKIFHSLHKPKKI